MKESDTNKTIHIHEDEHDIDVRNTEPVMSRHNQQLIMDFIIGVVGVSVLPGFDPFDQCSRKEFSWFRFVSSES